MGVASQFVWRLINWLERARCAVLGHRIFDDPRFSWAWCVRCTKRWKR